MKILLDADDVLADFSGFLFRKIAEETGFQINDHDFQEWDIFPNLAPEHAEVKDRLLKEPGTAARLVAKEGVIETLERLRAHHTVVCVTAPPLKSPTWANERAHWLIALGFQEEDIISTTGKHHVPGDVFVDDKPENCARWHQEHPSKLSVLHTYPRTSKAVLPEKIRKISKLPELLDIIM